jgi:hypothetical protein
MAASTANPMSRTLPVLSTMTFSGISRPWHTPTAWPAATAPATSDTSQAARRGPSGPEASMMSSESPEPHSLMT